MLYQYERSFSLQMRSQLIWSRCVNVHGHPGKNIEADLHVEHLNSVAKQSIKTIGPNKTQKAIERLGIAIGTLAPVLTQFDEDNDIAENSGAHKALQMHKDRTVVVSELMNVGVFRPNGDERKHHSFPHPRNILHHKSNEVLTEWIENKIYKIK